MTFRDRLREEIEYKGFQIKEIALATGISTSTFLSYIDARAVIPNVENAVKIAKVLDVSVEYLVTGEDSVHGGRYKTIQSISADLLSLDKESLDIVKRMIHVLVPPRK